MVKIQMTNNIQISKFKTANFPANENGVPSVSLKFSYLAILIYL